jgi:hypothetical protein
MTLKTSEIIGIIQDELTRARGGEYDETTANRTEALNYYYNRPRGDEVEGQSKVQSSDVNDMVEAVTSNISPILTNEMLVAFEASGEEDEPKAQLESDFVSYMVNGHSDGYVEIQSALKDALLQRNGWLNVTVEEDNHSETVTMPNVNEFEVVAALESSDNETSVELISMEEDKDGATWNATLKYHTHKRELKVRSVAPENMTFSQEHKSPVLTNCRFLAERKLLTRSELVSMGYPKSQVMKLPALSTDTKHDANARDEDNANSDNFQTLDEANEVIETFDCHIQMDVEESGQTKLRRIHAADDEILLNEIAEWIPYATGSPFLVPHRLYGQSLFDKLKSIQDSKTDSIRQWHNNMRRVNNARLIYNPLTTQEDDVNTSRAGANIRSKDPGNVGQVQTNDMGGSIMAGLAYMDKQRSERGGASLDLASAEMQLAGNVGDQGAERQISIKEQLAGQMTRTLANTLIKQTYILVHSTLRLYMPGELTAKLNGNWTTTDPSDWAERRKVNVQSGMTQGEKQQRLQALNALIAQQVNFISQGKGDEITNDGKVYNAVMDWSRAANLDNPEQYWIDPDSEQAMQAKQGKAEQAQAQQQAQVEAQNAMIEKQTQMQAELFGLSKQLEKYVHDSELVYKYASDRLDAEVEEAKIVGSSTLDLTREQLRFANQGNKQEQAASE